MRVTAERQDADIAILHLDGRLDLVSAATVKSEILKMVNDGHPRVVVDLQGVPFIDSSGLGALTTPVAFGNPVGVRALSRPTRLQPGC